MCTGVCGELYHFLLIYKIIKLAVETIFSSTVSIFIRIEVNACGKRNFTNGERKSEIERMNSKPV